MELFDPAALRKAIKQFENVRNSTNALMRSELHKITDRHLARCKKNTAVGISSDSPTLRFHWDRSGVHEMADGLYAEVFNNASYASFYEFGHRQKPGRIVFIELSPGGAVYGRPALEVKTGKHKGKWGIFIKLKKSYVKGRFVMTDSEQKVQQELDTAAKRIEKAIEEGLR